MYRFTRIDRQVFDLGIAAAVRMNAARLDGVAFGQLMARPLGEIRAALRIDRAQLIETYERERALWPASPASQRLPRAACVTS